MVRHSIVPERVASMQRWHALILDSGKLEVTARQAYSATGADPFFLFTHPIAAVFMAMAAGVILYTAWKPRQTS